MINIDDLIGVKYKRNGRTKDGFDCFGLAIEVSKRFGHEMPDIEEARKEDYNFDECNKVFLKKVKLEEIPFPKEEGDIVCIHEIGKTVSHIGIYLGNNQIIHCDYHGVHIDRVSRLRGLIGRVYKWQ